MGSHIKIRLLKAIPLLGAMVRSAIWNGAKFQVASTCVKEKFVCEDLLLNKEGLV